jgi:hypothetical protein
VRSRIGNIGGTGEDPTPVDQAASGGAEDQTTKEKRQARAKARGRLLEINEKSKPT